MTTRHYGHIEGSILSHYQKRGDNVTVEPPGRGRPDIEGLDSQGGKIVGEIKSAAESESSPGSWWAYWNSGERQLARMYTDNAQDLAPAPRGWCAVIDGQLREYCAREGVSTGELVIESYDRFAAAVGLSIEYLRHNARIKVLAIDTDSAGLGYVTIRFN